MLEKVRQLVSRQTWQARVVQQIVAVAMCSSFHDSVNPGLRISWHGGRQGGRPGLQEPYSDVRYGKAGGKRKETRPLHPQAWSRQSVCSRCVSHTPHVRLQDRDLIEYWTDAKVEWILYEKGHELGFGMHVYAYYMYKHKEECTSLVCSPMGLGALTLTYIHKHHA